MFYYNDKGRRIDIFNTRPRNLSKGGLIEAHPNMPKKDLNEDIIRADLEFGSLVVPKKVVKLLKDYEGEITGKKQTSSKHLTPAIVMPGEVVVNKKHADKVERFLKKRGITLPLKD